MRTLSLISALVAGLALTACGTASSTPDLSACSKPVSTRPAANNPSVIVQGQTAAEREFCNSNERTIGNDAGTGAVGNP